MYLTARLIEILEFANAKASVNVARLTRVEPRYCSHLKIVIDATFHKVNAFREWPRR
jgi:hypothetical protein